MKRSLWKCVRRARFAHDSHDIVLLEELGGDGRHFFGRHVGVCPRWHAAYVLVCGHDVVFGCSREIGGRQTLAKNRLCEANWHLLIMALARRLLHVSSRCATRGLSSCPRGGVCGATRCEFRYAIITTHVHPKRTRSSYSHRRAYSSLVFRFYLPCASRTTATSSRPPFVPPARTITDMFRQPSPTGGTFAEEWCQDKGTYPIIVIMGIATLLCTTSVLHHTRMPTTTWNKKGAYRKVLRCM